MAPPYARIVAEIRHRITTGELRAGDRVPSTRQITQRWGVAMATATKVLTTLRQEGVVEAKPGVGTVVAQPHRAARELDQARIIHTATQIADVEGLSALSMRRVATDLGVATMSLYRHLPGKGDLLMLMVDNAFAEITLPHPPPSGWRPRLEVLARLQWAVFRGHPWLAQAVSVTRPLPSRSMMSLTEWVLSAVDGLGLDPATMLHVLITMFNYVRGTAVNLESEARARQDTGLDEDEWMDTQAETYGEIIASGQFPVFARIAQFEFDFDLDAVFEFGLVRMLDGLAVLFTAVPPSE